MTWHSDPSKRKQYGDMLESAFAKEVRCSCSDSFVFIGDAYLGNPDFTCKNCGLLVDVKGSPQAERTGFISVSAKPWKGYPWDLLLVTKIGGIWIGEYKKHIHLENECPHAPTHRSTNSHLKNTRWHLISWRQFRKLTDMGFTING